MDPSQSGQSRLSPPDTVEKTASEPVDIEKRAESLETKQHNRLEDTPLSNEAVEDVANDGELSSPPDTSSVSSLNPDVLGDEIVVGTRSNGVNPPIHPAASEQGDVYMPDLEEEEPVSHYPKRKRSALYSETPDDKTDDSPARDADSVSSTVKGKPRPKAEEAPKHVPIGYWRDSPVPQEEGKHVVVGFIDIRDRLRTRIRSTTLTGEPINNRLFPIPPGPGGSWVTFERIVFRDYLVGHDHNVIKEYVKVRGENLHIRAAEADYDAIREAQRRLNAKPPPETQQPPLMAWGRNVPINPQVGRPEAKRRRTGNGTGTIADRDERTVRDRNDHIEQAEQMALVPHQPMSEAASPMRKPTRILVGCWSKSDQPLDKDKHAVYGILGANDMFRVKLVRETMDGRFLDGNYPNGAGALWIPYDDVKFLNHLKDLTRTEVKEYIRIRQSQLDAGEAPDEQVANETKAVYEAQARAAAIAAASPSRIPPPQSIPNNVREESREHHEPRHLRRELPMHGEIRHEQRHEQPHPPRHALPDVEYRHVSRPLSNDPIERVQGFANREVAKMEAVQQRATRNQATRNSMPSPSPSMFLSSQELRHSFDQNVQKMNNIWRSQQENIQQAPENKQGDVMLHQGVRYERKQTGPFKDKLVSQGTIINIDGEDYVEYRVLTKPSFF
ncbi:uncharacterized protein GGS25DRAFT_479560 [Hypoxylon fragiforme]|uniref:uncharacterized protein n=1 Tax=Hypoxylon fragiforme TaxID=63214 RepID=UPI0020C72B6C|nr:uncharacterized protein GGS25DRAFT_479560 [Hypoxylon fragiforme]KAI2610728.1 hypothetical protein GGS25DRAFT_479560 [Hypoxylon fragiforme]